MEALRATRIIALTAAVRLAAMACGQSYPLRERTRLWRATGESQSLIFGAVLCV